MGSDPKADPKRGINKLISDQPPKSQTEEDEKEKKRKGWKSGQESPQKAKE